MNSLNRSHSKRILLVLWCEKEEEESFCAKIENGNFAKSFYVNREKLITDKIVEIKCF